MDLRARRAVPAGVFAALLVAAAVVSYLAVRGGAARRALTDHSVRIPTAGATLSAEVFTPATHGPAPLVVMPAAWGAGPAMYHAIAGQLADTGYAVVAYAQRGLGGSTGAVDFAGADTQRDARVVIDWALAHLPADPAHVGMFGVSYGGAVSLLTAAHDPRVRAVVALSSWADFARTFDPGDTPHTAALLAVLDHDPATHFDATVQRLADTAHTFPADLGPVLRAMSPNRSPSSLVARLDANDPAIMIGNGFEDSIIDPAQLVPFFTALHTPKRLELSRGDHIGPERTGLAGGADPVVGDARAWLDHYLRGADNGIDRQPPILLRDARTGRPSVFASWPRATPAEQVPLGPPGAPYPPGGDVRHTWSATIATGTDSGATSGSLELVPGPAYRPPGIRPARLAPHTAFVWQGPPLGSAYPLRGTPRLHIGLAASAPTVTLYAYLYDVTPDGAGTLIEAQPFTATRLRPDTAATVDIAMQPIAWTLAAGEHVALVIDTVDPHFTSRTPVGATVTVSSTAADPAVLSAPRGL
jgi:predicted acyl esterase